MAISNISDAYQHGLSSEKCPITRAVLPNMTRSFEGFHISYAGYIAHYGSDTTAIVLQGRVFFILNGYHAGDLGVAAEKAGLQGCIDIFIERIREANRYSEHRMAVGAVADPFSLFPTTLELLGQHNVERIIQSLRAQST